MTSDNKRKHIRVKDNGNRGKHFCVDCCSVIKDDNTCECQRFDINDKQQ